MTSFPEDDPAALLARAKQDVLDRAFTSLAEQRAAIDEANATIERQTREIAALRARCDELAQEIDDLTAERVARSVRRDHTERDPAKAVELLNRDG